MLIFYLLYMYASWIPPFILYNVYTRVYGSSKFIHYDDGKEQFSTYTATKMYAKKKAHKNKNKKTLVILPNRYTIYIRRRKLTGCMYAFWCIFSPYI